MGMGKVSIFCNCLILAVGCGKSPSNVDIPKPVSQLGPEDQSLASKVLENKWNGFLDVMGLPKLYQPTMADLREALTLPPKAASKDLMPENYTFLQKEIVKSVLLNAPSTQCDVSSLQFADHKVVPVIGNDGQVSEISANTYLMKFKTLSGKEGADAAHYAFVTLPHSSVASSPVPLALYGRDSDSGLLLNEALTIGQAFYKNYIIVSPAFPGDTVWSVTCPTRGHPSCKELVKSPLAENVFEGDALTMLAAQNCLTKIQNLDTIKTYFPNEEVVTNPFKGRIKNHANLAQAVAIGMGRGGLSAQLAVAYSGVFVANGLGTPGSETSQNFKNQYGSEFLPNLISSMGIISAPSSFLMGRYRVGFENAFKGRVALSPFKRIPGFLGLEKLFFPLRQNQDTTPDTVIKQFAVEIAKRDMLFMGGYLGAGLQKWSQKLPNPQSTALGAAAYFHGTQDVVVPYEQVKISYTVATQLHKAIDAGALPGASGFSYGVFSFQPTEKYLETCSSGKCLTKEFIQHGDTSFLDSVFVADFSDAEIDAQNQQQNFDTIFANSLFGTNGASPLVLGSVRQTLYILANGVMGKRQAKEAPAFFEGGYTAEAKKILNPMTPPAVLVLWLNTLAKGTL